MIESINSVYLASPYSIFGVPFVFLGLVVTISAMFQMLDFADLDMDGESGFLGNVFITSGISRVPLLIGLLFTFGYAHLFLYALHVVVLTQVLPELIAKWVAWASAPFIFFGSLYVAGFTLRPLAKAMSKESRLQELDGVGSKGITTLSICGERSEVIAMRKDGCVDHCVVVSHDGSEIPIRTPVVAVAQREDGALLVKPDNS